MVHKKEDACSLGFINFDRSDDLNNINTFYNKVKVDPITFASTIKRLIKNFEFSDLLNFKLEDLISTYYEQLM